MTRVGLVCGRLEPEHDGVADYTMRLARALPAAGVEATVVPAAPAARCLAALAALDVVHVQWAPTAYRQARWVRLLPLLPRPGARRPLVTTVHEYASAVEVGGVGRVLERTRRWDADTGLLVRASALVIATNAGHAGALRTRHPAAAVEVVPIGPNVEPYPGDREQARREVRAELGLPPGAPVLAFFGFVHPVKGVRYLLAALPELRRTWTQLHTVVAGGFESLALPGAQARSFEAELRAVAADAGVSAAVTFTGYRPEPQVARLLAAADVAVLPFTHGVTTKSGALLAAMAAGLPVVATAAAEPDPRLVDGETVVLVRAVRDAPAVAAGVRRVLGDPVLARRVAAGGARLAAAHSWAGIAGRHAALYDSVLLGDPP